MKEAQSFNEISFMHSLGFFMAKLLCKLVYAIYVLCKEAILFRREQLKKLYSIKRVLGKVSILLLSLWFFIALLVLSH